MVGNRPHLNLMRLDMQRTAKALAAALVLLGLVSPLCAAEPAIPLPGGTMAQARAGFTSEQARDFRQRYSPESLISAGDVALFHFIDIGLWLETVIAARSGEVMKLDVSLDPAIGQTRVESAGGGLPLLASLHGTDRRPGRPCHSLQGAELRIRHGVAVLDERHLAGVDAGVADLCAGYVHRGLCPGAGSHMDPWRQRSQHLIRLRRYRKALGNLPVHLINLKG